jgi:K+-sensing histidine kinase KdpD
VADRQDAPGTDPGSGEQREKGEERSGFLGFVAHEMRNPLSTALWSAELLARLSPEERAGPRGEKLSGMCLRALQRLRLLIEDHFLAERLAVGGIPFKPDDVSVREALEAVGPKTVGADLAVAVEDGLAARVDRGLFERALDGLLASAARGKAPVKVEATRSQGLALIRVMGAPPPADAFAPPQKGTASDPTGRALALYMVSSVARTLGGQVSASADEYLLELPLGQPNAGAGTK